MFAVTASSSLAGDEIEQMGFGEYFHIISMIYNGLHAINPYFDSSSG